MNFSMNETKIKQLCGITAYKKGKTYYQAGKVNLDSFQEDNPEIKASVKAGDDFNFSDPVLETFTLIQTIVNVYTFMFVSGTGTRLSNR